MSMFASSRYVATIAPLARTALEKPTVPSCSSLHIVLSGRSARHMEAVSQRDTREGEDQPTGSA